MAILIVETLGYFYLNFLAFWQWVCELFYSQSNSKSKGTQVIINNMDLVLIVSSNLKDFHRESQIFSVSRMMV